MADKFLKLVNGVLVEAEAIQEVPSGGTTGQLLAKKTNADLDTEWIDPPAGGGAGNNYAWFMM